MEYSLSISGSPHGKSYEGILGRLVRSLRAETQRVYHGLFDGYSWRSEDCYMIQQAKENIDYYLEKQAEIPFKYQEVADAAMNG